MSVPAFKTNEPLPGISNEYNAIIRETRHLFGRSVTAKDSPQIQDLIAKIEGLMKTSEKHEMFCGSLEGLHGDLKKINQTLHQKSQGSGKRLTENILKSIRTANMALSMEVVRTMRENVILPPQSLDAWRDIPFFHPNLNMSSAYPFMKKMPEGTYLIVNAFSPKDAQKMLFVRSPSGEVEMFIVKIVEGRFSFGGRDTYSNLNEFFEARGKQKENKLAFTHPCLNTPSFSASINSMEIAEQTLLKSGQQFLLRSSSLPDYFAINFLKDGKVQNYYVQFTSIGWRLVDNPHENPDEAVFQEAYYPTLEELFETELREEPGVQKTRAFLNSMPLGTYTFIKSNLKESLKNENYLLVRTSGGLETIAISDTKDGLIVIWDDGNTEVLETLHDLVAKYPDKFKYSYIIENIIGKIPNIHDAKLIMQENKRPIIIFSTDSPELYRLSYSLSTGPHMQLIGLTPGRGWHLLTKGEKHFYPTPTDLLLHELIRRDIPTRDVFSLMAASDPANQLLVRKIPSAAWDRYEKLINDPPPRKEELSESQQLLADERTVSDLFSAAKFTEEERSRFSRLWGNYSELMHRSILKSDSQLDQVD